MDVHDNFRIPIGVICVFISSDSSPYQGQGEEAMIWI
jgi:hypothetical protein